MAADPGGMGYFRRGQPFRYVGKPTTGLDRFRLGEPFRGVIADQGGGGEGESGPPYLVQEDGVSRFMLEDGSGALILEGEGVNSPPARPKRFVPRRRHR